MAKHRPSLEALAGAVAPRPSAVIVPGPGAQRGRDTRPHMSLYLAKPVQRVLKKIAADLDRKPHDLLVEGVELVLARYGKPTIADIERGDVTTL
jgi:hypothetical protein